MDELNEQEQAALQEQEQAELELPEDTEEQTEEQASEQAEEQETEEKEESEQEVDPQIKALEEKYNNIQKALSEERNLRKQFSGELSARELEIKKMEDRFQKIQERFSKEEIPDPDENPLGHLAYNQKILQEKIEQYDSQNAQQEEIAQKQQYIGQIQNKMVSLEQQYATQQPDYYDAVEFLRSVRDRDYQAMGVTDPAERAQMVNNDAFYIVQNALAKDQDAAAVFYNIAQNYGYQQKQQQENKQANREKLETQKKAMEQSKSLGSKGSSGGGLTLRQISNMSDEEFENMTDDQWEALWQ